MCEDFVCSIWHSPTKQLINDAPVCGLDHCHLVELRILQVPHINERCVNGLPMYLNGQAQCPKH